MTTVTAPVAGRAIGLAAVPDPVFAEGMVGPGTAIEPLTEPTRVVSPVDGVVVSIHAHAFVVVDAEGHGVLTHVGIDTVRLGGAGFELLVHKGDRVVRGQPIVSWNPAEVAAAGKSPVCPVIALEADSSALTDVVESGEVEAGSLLFDWK